jgi:HD superfamily phosphohydrolase YqeK
MIHGFNHTFRVMVNVLTIGNAIGLNNEVKEAFCAAFVHDMSRK